jgi:hypothetical protein
VLVKIVGHPRRITPPRYRPLDDDPVVAGENIERNHHLPEVPSAKGNAEKGVSLGEKRAKLPAKTEELTHMIAAEKENGELRKHVQELRERVGRTERAGGGR